MTAERDALIAAAQRIGADPLDLATVISYETGGTMSPGIRGGAGNRHIGLIQFGIPEQQRYGASQGQGQSFGEQLGAVESYLTDRGFKPGMGLLDLYSTINAGRPGRYGASDAGNGGAPGTVADKVNFQMGKHRDKAAAFLGGDFTPQAPRGGGGAPAPFGFTAPAAASPNPPPSAGEGDDYAEMSRLLASLTRAPAQDAEVPAAPQAPQMLAPTRAAPQFDASRFFALLPRRA